MIEELKAWGCNTADALERMVGDEEFYRECLLDIPSEPCFEQLGQALRDGDTLAAFDAAHTLKGVLSNLGLTPMYDTVVSIVEPLRAGRGDGLMEPYQQLLRQRAKLEEILRGEP